MSFRLIPLDVFHVLQNKTKIQSETYFGPLQQNFWNEVISDGSILTIQGACLL